MLFLSYKYPSVILWCPQQPFWWQGIEILRNNHIQDFTLKEEESVKKNPNDNGPNLKLKNLYSNKTKLDEKAQKTQVHADHMNALLVETWEAFKLSFIYITKDSFKR